MSFSDWRERLGRFRFTLLLVTLIALSMWIGYGLANARLSWLEQQQQRSSETIERLRQSYEQLEYENNILRVELEVENVATRRLQQALRDSLDDYAAARQELAFYQRVMAPELEADGITIDSFNVRPTGPGIYHFSLTLVRIERAQQQIAQGQVELELQGRHQGQNQVLDLFDLANLGGDRREFAMNYFTNLDGSFQVPADFMPQTVVVRVQSNRGGNTEQVFLWRELLGTVDESPDVGENAPILNVRR
ncbi:DUF6776 family protein [Aliidiomarina sp. Khilg15.8]